MTDVASNAHSVVETIPVYFNRVESASGESVLLQVSARENVGRASERQEARERIHGAIDRFPSSRRATDRGTLDAL